MKKYLKYFLVLLILTICCSVNVSALDCYYEASGSNQLKAHFRINDNNGEIVFSGIEGTLQSKDSDGNKTTRTVKGQGQKIENWETIFNPLTEIGEEINFSGLEYYNRTKSCPPSVILVDRLGQFDFAVVGKDENFNNYNDEFQKYGASKQGYSFLMLKPMDEDNIIYYPSSCLGLNKSSCKGNLNYACVWVENESAPNKGYCNVDNLLYVGCGGAGDIPVQVPSLISMLVNMLKIATPIILIFISMVTLFKALVAQKEDEIKKATNSLVKKIIAGALVFFVVAIVQYIISVVAEDDYYEGFESCLDCFLNNSCETNTYYKTVVSGEEMCTFLTTGETEACSNLFGESK
ncbi:MAG: hypothetical protein E7174_01260 [Firmicutes bacterium]|nr:hypothetical protein [Bacillota bacterium]